MVCLPQALEKHIYLGRKLDLDTANELQNVSLSIIHNLSSSHGTPNYRMCQYNRTVSILVTLLDLPDFPEVSNNVAGTLLNFASYKENYEFILPSLEQILLLVIREAPCSRILTKLIAKLEHFEIS